MREQQEEMRLHIDELECVIEDKDGQLDDLDMECQRLEELIAKKEAEIKSISEIRKLRISN